MFFGFFFHGEEEKEENLGEPPALFALSCLPEPWTLNQQADDLPVAKHKIGSSSPLLIRGIWPGACQSAGRVSASGSRTRQIGDRLGGSRTPGTSNFQRVQFTCIPRALGHPPIPPPGRDELNLDETGRILIRCVVYIYPPWSAVRLRCYVSRSNHGPGIPWE